MKKTVITVLGICFLLATAMDAGAAVRDPARPLSALFYPNEVEVTVEEKLSPEDLPDGGKAFVLQLPVRSNRQSFTITVDGVPAESFYWLDKEELIRPLESGKRSASPRGARVDLLMDPDEETDQERRAILEAIRATNLAIEQHTAAKQALENRISLWQSYYKADNELTPADILTLDKAFSEILPGLFEGRSREDRQLNLDRNKLSRLEAELRTYDQVQSRLVVIVPASRPRSSTLRYSYVLPGSFQLAYKLNAFPTEDRLEIEQIAHLTQHSGFSWDSVDVSISTTPRDTAIHPNPVQPWFLSIGVPQAKKSASAAQRSPSAPNRLEQRQLANSDFLAEYAEDYAPAPAQQEMGTFRLWTIGKRTIETGVAVSVPMTSESYAAKYYYTLRPAMNSKGFLTAELNLDHALELPYGNARFFVDNSLVGSEAISINGSKATAYFGTDPQIVAQRKNVQHTTGEEGFISKEQSVLWDWEISVRNTRGRSVEVWVEDPRPDAQAESIKISVDSNPKPEEVTLKPQQGGSKVYRWKLELGPNEVKTIKHKVRVLAPKDEHLNTGRND